MDQNQSQDTDPDFENSKSDTSESGKEGGEGGGGVEVEPNIEIDGKHTPEIRHLREP